MEGLGRLYDFVPAASAKPFRLNANSGVTLLAVASSTTTTTLTVTYASTFSGSYSNFTTANGCNQPGHWYQNTASDGTAQWVTDTASWASNVLTIGATSGYSSVVEIFGSMLPAGAAYLKVTAANASLVAVVHDLTVQRKPDYLVALGS
jgi:hypothetical protein